jgi:hypothetical protein
MKESRSTFDTSKKKDYRILLTVWGAVLSGIVLTYAFPSDYLAGTAFLYTWIACGSVVGVMLHWNNTVRLRNVFHIIVGMFSPIILCGLVLIKLYKFSVFLLALIFVLGQKTVKWFYSVT